MSGIDSLFQLGLRLRQEGRLDEAAFCFRKQLVLDPRHLQSSAQLGEILSCLAERSGTPHVSEGSSGTDEDFARQGMELQAAGQVESSLFCFQMLVRTRPGFMPGYLYLGDALHRLGRFSEAVEVYDRALTLNPDFAAAHNNRGNSLLELGRNEEAIASYHRMLRLRPEYAKAHVAIATALQAMGKPEEAVFSCRQALEITPECAEAHWNLSLALLQLGNFRQGWREFEWRWHKEDFPSPLRSFPQPLWDGSELNGRTILLHAEQGLGDAIQFVRYAPLVAGHGGEVIIECHPPLKDLFKGIAGVNGVCAAGEPLPPFDVHAPFMSLPGIMGTLVETIPSGVPYLTCTQEIIMQWRKLLGIREGFRVGLVWAGNKRHINDRNRSCPMHQLSPLLKIDGVSWYSLQLGDAAKELTELSCSLTIVDLTSHIADFNDTAGLIANLDLVIAVDTAVAHLAGALAVPVWTLHAFAADWRWLLHRNDSPWYPSMRLFRQRSPGDWEGVVGDIAAALEEQVHQSDGGKNFSRPASFS